MTFSRRPGPRFNRGRVQSTARSLLALFSGGLYFDFRDEAYDGLGQGETITTLTPRLGTGALTGTGTPIVDLVTSIGGRRTIKCVSADSDALEAHWLGALVNGNDTSVTIMARCRIDETGSKTLVGFGNSGSGTINYVEIFQTSTTAPFNSRARDGVGGANVNSGSFGNIGFADHTIAWVRNGTTVTAYLDGVPFGSPATIDVGAITCDQFRWASGGRNVLTPQGCGMQCLAVAPRVLSAAEVLAVHNAWVALDLPATVGTPIVPAGDSLTKGPSSGGYRAALYNWWVANITGDLAFVGTQVSGAFPNNQHEGYASQEIAQIAAHVVAACGSGKAFQPRLVIYWAGTNDINNGGLDPVGDALAAYTTALEDIHTAIVTGDASAQIMVTTLTDYLGFETEVSDFNAGLPAIWDAFDTLHASNTLLRIDLYTALGAAGTSGDWQADGVHLTDAGHAKVRAEITDNHAAFLQSIAAP